MEYQVKFDQGMINRGNWKKIKECMKKAESSFGNSTS